MFKLFSEYMDADEADIILQDKHTCVVKLQRNETERFCSLIFASMTNDWGTYFHIL